MWNLINLLMLLVFAVPCEDVKRFQVSCTGPDTTMTTEVINGELFVCCYEGIATVELPENEGCNLPCDDPPPPQGGCCLSSGECQITDSVLSSATGSLDTRGCTMPVVDVQIAGTWNYDAPIVIGRLIVTGNSVLEPEISGNDKDVDLIALELNGFTLSGANAVLEFHSLPGGVDIVGKRFARSREA